MWRQTLVRSLPDRLRAGQEARAHPSSHAERVHDHELLNILAGAAAVIDVLEHEAAGPYRDQLFRVLGDEVERMRRHVADNGGVAPRSSMLYDAAFVIADVVVMYTCGVPVRVDVEPSLLVRGDPDSLRHALVNVLLNCARHAPGSAVVVRAESDGERTHVRVEDDGPVAPSPRGPAALSEGVGLAFSRRLLAAEGATIKGAHRDDAPGWSAVISLATAGAR